MDNLTINIGKLSTNDHQTRTKGSSIRIRTIGLSNQKIIDNIEKLKNTHTNHHCVLIDRGDYILYMLQCRVFFTATPSTSRRTLQANKKQKSVIFLVIFFNHESSRGNFLIAINVLAWLRVPST
jgi:hypothetical protein